MTVQATSYSGTISEFRSYSYTYQGGDVLGTGAVTLRVPYYLTNVPLTAEYEYVDSLSGSLQYLHSNYSCDWTYDYVLSLIFPTNFQYKVINGTFSVELWQYVDNIFYSGLNNQVTESYFTDFTQRLDVSAGDLDLEGVSYSVMPASSYSQSSPRYRLTLHFDNYYVPKSDGGYSTQVAGIGIPLKLNYTMNAQKLIDNVAPGGDVNEMTALTQSVRFVPINGALSADNMSFEPASFFLDNDYYTFLRALDNSGMAIDVFGLQDMLRQWTGYTAGSIPIDFSTFANQVLSALGSSGTTNSQQMQVIFGYLASLVATQGNLEDYLYNIYRVIELEPPYDQDGMPNGNFAGYIAAIYVALCGYETYDLDTDFPEISAFAYNRWVRIIKEAIEDQLSMENVAGSDAAAEYETNAASADVLVGDVEDMENDLWTDVNHYVVNIGTVSDITAPVSSVPAAVWFVSAVENVWSRLGIFSFVITVSLFGGILVILLGRIGGMFRGDPPQKNS